MKRKNGDFIIQLAKKLRCRRAIMIALDILISFGMAGLFLLLDNHTATDNFGNRFAATAIMFALIYASRFLFFVYRRVWRYAGSFEYMIIVVADFVGGIVYLIFDYLFFLPQNLGIRLIQAFSIVSLSCLCSLTIRFFYKCLYHALRKHDKDMSDEDMHKIPIAIVGAGAVGVSLASDLQSNPRTHYKPYCFIDSDMQKIGNMISGLRVYSEDGILQKLEDMPVKEIVISIPSLGGDQKAKLFDFYNSAGFKVKIYDTPLLDQEGETAARKTPVLRELHIEELLSREEISVNSERTGMYYKGKTVLITGGGGSIGSEICRQVAKFIPKQIVIFDIYENNAYDIQQEMKLLYGDSLDLRVEISSVRDECRVRAVMEQYHPDIVIHAAAHKHVPLMEHNCSEAVKNNVFGTLNVVNAAEQFGVKKFIMVSTDKAVNPTNVMGATKRMCEMIVQSRQGSKTEFTAVRFGNVLGSNGSVIPLFKRMIARGGPITVTDKRIIRYFMTIPEASQLVLEAGSMAKNGELYVLDMGKPVHILKLAEDMIRLSGFEPYKDIDIIETGLRPGEKLWEELLVKNEEIDKTDNEKIFIERDKGLTREEVAEKLSVLKNAVNSGDSEKVKEALKLTVPTYKDPKEVNAHALQNKTE